jgi:4-hydroxybenzoate polyprenyltransferase/phosphoserine phosphatase
MLVENIDATPVPLVVDLDGTLILTDMLHESTLRLLRDRPAQLVKLPVWLADGKASLKQKLAQLTEIDAVILPYNHPFLDWLRSQKAKGRRLILCTASDQRFAQAIAVHLGIFDEVIASDGVRNIAGDHKAAVLTERFGAGGFDYAGNSAADLHVWKHARHAIVVNASPSLERKAKELCTVEHTFPPPAQGPRLWSKVFRTHQWLKNILLFIPLLASHDLGNTSAWITLVFAFFSFSICASAVYVANDLLDLESDRLHPRKKKRPFAAGLVPVAQGVALVPLLLFIAFSIGALVGPAFLGWLFFYFIVTCVYSWSLKRILLVDCLTLAMLYTLRIVAGAAAISNVMSFWLLAFSVFLFLSLAFVKRYAELEALMAEGGSSKMKLHGRGYTLRDAPLIQTMGIVAGYAAVLVLALYLNSSEVLLLYPSHEVIWGAVPIVLFWISWMWFQANRGLMDDDPLIYAVKDRTSLMAGLCFGLLLAAGSTRVLW